MTAACIADALPDALPTALRPGVIRGSLVTVVCIGDALAHGLVCLGDGGLHWL